MVSSHSPSPPPVQLLGSTIKGEFIWLLFQPTLVIACHQNDSIPCCFRMQLKFFNQGGRSRFNLITENDLFKAERLQDQLCLREHQLIASVDNEDNLMMFAAGHTLIPVRLRDFFKQRQSVLYGPQPLEINFEVVLEFLDFRQERAKSAFQRSWCGVLRSDYW